MTTKTKTITGASVIGGLLIVFKLWHAATALSDIVEPESNQLKILPAIIITTDSSGKSDTMKLEDYLKQNKIGDTMGK